VGPVGGGPCGPEDAQSGSDIDWAIHAPYAFYH
jgi:hypothetical protein